MENVESRFIETGTGNRVVRNRLYKPTVEFCTSAASNGSHVSLPRHLLSLQWQRLIPRLALVLLGSREGGEKVICSGAVRHRVVFTSQTNAVDVRTFATVVVAKSSLSADGPRFIIRYDGKPARPHTHTPCVTSR